MKRLSILITLLLFATHCLAAETTTLDGIAAKVNDQIITQSELNNRADIFAKQLQEQQIKLPPRHQFLHQVLQMIVDETLQLQMAQRANITVTDEEVTAALNQMAAGQKISRTQLLALANKHGVSSTDFTKNIRNQLIIQKLQKEAVIPEITISPAEINSYLRSALSDNQPLYLYHLEDILVGVSDAPTPAELEAAKQKAQYILIQLQGGTDFRTLAVGESNGEQALHGGDLGWRSLAELPPIFADQVSHMKAGDLAGPIQTPNGFHIIHLIGSKRNTVQPDTNNLRNQVSDMLFRQKLEERLQIWVQQLRAQSYVKMYV